MSPKTSKFSNPNSVEINRLSEELIRLKDQVLFEIRACSWTRDGNVCGGYGESEFFDSEKMELLWGIKMQTVLVSFENSVSTC
ncbi:hypothetical protein C5167_030367 [Papaver somniferum]|nr:hypothetical protein C5167_030367 [Papaver somniferum]